MTAAPAAAELDSRSAAAVTVRPVVLADLPALETLLHALDTRSRYRRWFSVATDVHAAAVWAADANGVDAVGLVATTVAGEIIGHAAFITMDTTRAEICFEVDAAWRHHGIAGRLLAELARRATTRGLTTLVAEVLAENADMLAVLREHGPCREQPADGVIEVQLTIPAVATTSG
jgi:ribosomal protein S18 acetylase RimI-like enzyme